LERIVDQITKVRNTTKKATQRYGENDTALRNIINPEKLDIPSVPALSALFLKQKFVNVSRKSENIRKDNIVIVSFFFNVSPYSLNFRVF
jgi:hypothetical protein